MSNGTDRASRQTILGRAYSAFMRAFFQKALVPRFATEKRLEEGHLQWSKIFKERSQEKGLSITRGFSEEQGSSQIQDGYQHSPSSLAKRASRTIWWHAASVGELEILWPVMIGLVRDESLQRVDLKPTFVITILSESADDRLKKLVRALEDLGVQPVFAGYSPWEGSWREALLAFSPDLFITSKYEAWPELWSSLAELGIPLTIVSAKDRKSLRVCRKVCELLGSKLPPMTLLTAIREDAPALKESFPQAEVEMVGEPRWDQVWNRAQSGHPRAKEIATCLTSLPRSWGVLGSAWHEDVALWKNLIPSLGTVLIVPHRIDSEHLKEIEGVLSPAGIKFLRTADYSSADAFAEALRLHPDVRCIVVNEMGFLSELYLAADWAYVGGGIGRRGVHSTIEPAIHGIPIACGSYRAHQFVEISELAASGQLTLVKTEDDLRRWVEGLNRAFSHREQWKLDARNRLGATQRIVRRIINAL